jgi:uncharacterized membrane protein
VWKAAHEPRLDRLPWLAALAGLLLLMVWPIGDWVPSGEPITVGGVLAGVLPSLEGWPPGPLRPFLLGALLLATMHAAAGFVMERRAARPLRWAALPAAVPVLALLIAYARVRGFALDVRWALVALALAAMLVGAASAAMRAGALRRAGAHAAGAVAALALGTAMVLSQHWLTLAVALFLPPLALIEARTRLPALRLVALGVAVTVLVRLLLNAEVLDTDFGPWPVLNEALLAYGVPALSFALAARLFRRRRDDRLVAVLEAGAIAFAAVLLVLEVRHAFHGRLSLEAGWGFDEAAWQVTALALLANALRLLNRGRARPMLREGWRLLLLLAAVGGTALILLNPALAPQGASLRWPILNALLPAYALPALLAAAAARAPESAFTPRLRRGLAGYAILAGFTWISLEVRRLFQPEAMLLDLAPPAGAELWVYTVAWLAYGGALMVLGLRLGASSLRLTALGVMALTVLKAVLVDAEELAGLWRVLSFLGLGLALIALGWVYRRFVVVTRPPPAPAPAPPA